MKPLTRSLPSIMLGGLALALTFLALPFTHASAGGQKTEKKWTVKSSRTKSDREVADRAKSLKKHSEEVRAAFGAFEKRGRAPKVDDAVLISGDFEPQIALGTGGLRDRSFFIKAGFAQEQSSIAGGGYE